MNRYLDFPRTAAALGLLAVALLSGAAGAARAQQTQETAPSRVAAGTGGCPVHVVRRGDALWELAESYLGSRDRALEIYRSNRRVIGRNPNVIEPGQRLTIPCDTPGGAVTQTRTTTETDPITEPVRDIVATPEEGLHAAAPTLGSGAEALAQALLRQEAGIPDGAEAPAPGFRGLAGGPLSPFIDRGLPKGGIAVALIDAAFAAVPGAGLEVGQVDDRAAHLEVVLPRGGSISAFRGSIPIAASTRCPSASSCCATTTSRPRSCSNT